MMTNELTTIHEQEVLGKVFKIYGDVDNPLFLAKDVAEWIEYSTDKVGQMLKTVDDDEKISSPIHYSGQVRNMYFLTEDGLYEVLMQSRKLIARHFKKRVKEILKDIRRDGGYIATNEDDDDATIMAKALLVAQKTIDRQNKQLEEEHKKIVEDRPKALLIEKIIATNVWIIM
jgi:prophage antirepressor-like protein